MREVSLAEVQAIAATLPRDKKNPGAAHPDSDERSTCHYLEDDGTPSCVAANIFHRLDATMLPKLIEVEAISNLDSTAHTVCEQALYELGIRFDQQAERYLQNAQYVADSDQTWGAAIDFATVQIPTANLVRMEEN